MGWTTPIKSIESGILNKITYLPEHIFRLVRSKWRCLQMEGNPIRRSKDLSGEVRHERSAVSQQLLELIRKRWNCQANV